MIIQWLSVTCLTSQLNVALPFLGIADLQVRLLSLMVWHGNAFSLLATHSCATGLVGYFACTHPICAFRHRVRQVQNLLLYILENLDFMHLLSLMRLVLVQYLEFRDGSLIFSIG